VRGLLAAVALALVALTSGGCQLLGLPGGSPDLESGIAYPDGCAVYDLSPRRCKAIVEVIGDRVGIAGREVTHIELLPDPGCGKPTDPKVLCTRTMAFVARVRFRFADGGSAEDSVFCGVGGQYTILCTETPEIRISSPTMGGYRDVPCAGEAPDGCATPLPTLEPTAESAARTLTIAVRDIPIDRIGKFEVSLGRAVLPNGILTQARFGLRDLKVQTFSVADAIWLDVRSIDPDAPPFDNYYVRGWHEGTETVEAVVIFEVMSFEPGAVLELRDVVVR
jgi:hypothetical protein